MAVPKRRKSKMQSRKSRSHHAVKAVQVAHCPQCGTSVPTHVICPNCGYYQGRTVVEPEE